jgi:hypothetical protein
MLPLLVRQASCNNQEEELEVYPRKEKLIFDNNSIKPMAEEAFMYSVTTGIFVFLVAVLFGSRAARKRAEPKEGSVETESHSASGPGSEGRRIKRFKSDGSPVYE